MVIPPLKRLRQKIKSLRLAWATWQDLSKKEKNEEEEKKR
jgi:hypothetical protein